VWFRLVSGGTGEASRQLVHQLYDTFICRTGGEALDIAPAVSARAAVRWRVGCAHLCVCAVLLLHCMHASRATLSCVERLPSRAWLRVCFAVVWCCGMLDSRGWMQQAVSNNAPVASVLGEALAQSRDRLETLLRDWKAEQATSPAADEVRTVRVLHVLK